MEIDTIIGPRRSALRRYQHHKSVPHCQTSCPVQSCNLSIYLTYLKSIPGRSSNIYGSFGAVSVTAFDYSDSADELSKFVHYEFSLKDVSHRLESWFAENDLRT